MNDKDLMWFTNDIVAYIHKQIDNEDTRFSIHGD